MPKINISLSGQIDDPITEINCGSSLPRLGGDINLSLFTELTGFYCTGHDIKTISDISNNVKLKKIDISDNQLTQITTSLTGNKNLQYFNCSKNKILAPIPDMNGDNVNLEYLDFSENNFTGLNNTFLPYQSSPKYKLKYLNLSNNNLNSNAVDTIISSIYDNNTNGGYLNLSGNNNSPPSAGKIILKSANGSSFTQSAGSNVVTVNCPLHSLVTNSLVTISEITSPKYFNGTFKVESATTNTFTYRTTGTAISSTNGVGRGIILSTSTSSSKLRLYQNLSLPSSQGGRGWESYISPYFIKQFGQTVVSTDDFFGFSVSIDSGAKTVIVGNPKFDNGVKTDAGVVRIYSNSSDINPNWVNTASLIATGVYDVANCQYGYSTSINNSGNVIAIGVPFSITGAGSIKTSTSFVDVFYKNGASWLRKGNMLTRESFETGNFGFDVLLNDNGNKIAISSPDTGSNQGFVKVYEFVDSQNNWFQLGTEIKDGTLEFGSKIAFSKDGNIIAATASQNTKVKIYQYEVIGANIDNWKFIKQFDNISNFSGFKVQSLSLNKDGTVLSIGVIENSGSTIGRVYVYKNNGVTWNLLGQIITGFSGDNKKFGFSVSLSDDGNRLTIGDPEAYSEFGEVKIYEFNSSLSIWQEIGVGISDASAGLFGYDLSLSSNGKYFVASSPNLKTIEVYETLN